MNHKDQWNRRFADEAYVFGTTPNRFLTQQARRLSPGSHVLAVADGEGRNGVWLAGQGHAVTSVDIADAGQSKAVRLAAERGVELAFITADLLAWQWPADRYDAVVAIFIQFAAPHEREILFDGMKRATRPGGLLLMQGYRPEQLGYGTGGPPMVENLYTEALLRDAFAGWAIEHLAVHDSVIEEGPGHSGMSALIDLVARRPD